MVLMGTHNLCFEQKYEKHQGFLSENFQFYLNRRVFEMKTDIRPLIFFLLTVPRQFLCSSSLFVRRWFHMWYFVLSLFVSHLSFFSCLGKAVIRDCGISWESSLIYYTFLVCYSARQVFFGPVVIIFFSSSTQLSVKFSLLINMKMQ